MTFMKILRLYLNNKVTARNGKERKTA